MADATPRWKYRFASYKNALILLREAMDKRNEFGLNQLEKEGAIQRFEVAMELAWKAMKDYLEHEGVAFDQITPRAVIRKAYEAKLTEHGPTWMDALDARNKMSHTYDASAANRVIEDVAERYLCCMEALYRFLMAKDTEHG